MSTRPTPSTPAVAEPLRPSPTRLEEALAPVADLATVTTRTDPLAERSTLPFELPPFAEIRDEDLGEAMAAGIAEARAEVEQIVANPEPPTMANTVEALNRSGERMQRATSVLSTFAVSKANETVRETWAQWAPRLAAHKNWVMLHPELYARLRAVRDAGPEGTGETWTPEQSHLLEHYLSAFAEAGAGTDDAARERLLAIHTRIAELTTTFGDHLQADTAELAVHVTDEAELAGLDEAEKAAAAAAATERGVDGWLLTLGLPARQPILARLERRDLRRRVHEASLARCSRGNVFDTRAIVLELTALRAEMAALLGRECAADVRLARETAGSSAAVEALLAPMIAPALANMERELAQVQAFLDDELGEERHDLAPWDVAYWTERLRRARFDVDTRALAAWFPLERVLSDGVLAAAAELYGLTFRTRDDLVGHVEGARVVEVDETDGTPVGLVIFDLFSRPDKRGGAWMNSLVLQNDALGQLPVVVNTLNLTPPAPGEPALLSLDEVDTLFHEFGHGLHGLLSKVRHGKVSGTQVPRDFVEFPSQVNEIWARVPAIRDRFARHVETGEPLPEGIVERLDAAAGFGEGLHMVEMLGAALLDQEWHRRRVDDGWSEPGDVESFEAAALERHGLAHPLVGPRYRSAFFNHIFCGAYQASYYSYLWAEVLDADAAEWFLDGAEPLREKGERFRHEVLSRGWSRDPGESFRALRGRDPRPAPVLARRGLR